MFREGVHPTDSETKRSPVMRTASAAAVALAVLSVGRRRVGRRRGGRRTFGRVIVSGESMVPGFEPGDRLLLWPIWRLKVGQVVALPDPRDATRLLVKRVHYVVGQNIDVRGDNDAASTDSRHFGPVRRSQLSGRVLYRYAPLGRTGLWPE
jgi:nickel-type superoxide dismutase maturation protease